jgi:hypothetical protein
MSRICARPRAVARAGTVGFLLAAAAACSGPEVASGELMEQ